MPSLQLLQEDKRIVEPTLLEAARAIMALIDEHGLGDDDRQVEAPVAALRAALDQRTTTYLAIQLGYWGRGATEEAALDNLRKAGGRYRGKNREHTLVYSVSHHPNEDKPWVDGYGTMCWHGDRRLVAEIIKGTRRAAPETPGDCNTCGGGGCPECGTENENE